MGATFQEPNRFIKRVQAVGLCDLAGRWDRDDGSSVAVGRRLGESLLPNWADLSRLVPHFLIRTGPVSWMGLANNLPIYHTITARDEMNQYNQRLK